MINATYFLCMSQINLWILSRGSQLQHHKLSFSGGTGTYLRAEGLKLTVRFFLSLRRRVCPAASCQKLFWVSNSSEFGAPREKWRALKTCNDPTDWNQNAAFVFRHWAESWGKASLVTTHVINRRFGGLGNGKHIHPWVTVKSRHSVSKNRHTATCTSKQSEPAPELGCLVIFSDASVTEKVTFAPRKDLEHKELY